MTDKELKTNDIKKIAQDTANLYMKTHENAIVNRIDSVQKSVDARVDAKLDKILEELVKLDASQKKLDEKIKCSNDILTGGKAKEYNPKEKGLVEKVEEMYAVYKAVVVLGGVLGVGSLWGLWELISTILNL